MTKFKGMSWLAVLELGIWSKCSWLVCSENYRKVWAWLNHSLEWHFSFLVPSLHVLHIFSHFVSQAVPPTLYMARCLLRRIKLESSRCVISHLCCELTGWARRHFKQGSSCRCGIIGPVHSEILPTPTQLITPLLSEDSFFILHCILGAAELHPNI